MICKAPRGLQMKNIKKKSVYEGCMPWGEWDGKNLLLLVTTQCCNIEPNILQSNLPMVDNFARDVKSLSWFFTFLPQGA